MYVLAEYVLSLCFEFLGYIDRIFILGQITVGCGLGYQQVLAPLVTFVRKQHALQRQPRCYDLQGTTR